MRHHTVTASICTRLALSVALALTALFAAGCDDSEGNYAHTPPPGQGSLIVDNNGWLNVSVFIDGVDYGDVRDGQWKAFDLEPGDYRVVLDEPNGDRSFRTDIDILQDRQTIMDNTGPGPGRDDLAVIVTFDK